MEVQRLLPAAGPLRCDRVEIDEDRVRLFVTSVASTSRCPRCGKASSRIHSRYERRLADLPMMGRQVAWCLRVRRFFCDAAKCSQRVFAERMPEVVRPYGRQTIRLVETWCRLALTCGGEAGSRRCSDLVMPTSADTLLRCVRRAPEPEVTQARVVGVDDWALRRGQRYGTILCDLETRRPIDLLPVRSSEAVAAWLKNHPGVQVVSRDRGDEYIKGVADGAPDAVQVADRWHLLQNLTEAVKRVVQQHHRQVAEAAEAVAAEMAANAQAPTPPGPPEPEQPKRPTRAEQIKQQNRQRRLARYNKIMELYRAEVPLRAIARQLGMNVKTVRRFVRAGSFPERATPPRRSRIEPHVGYLRQRWEAGCHDAAQLYREFRDRGFTGSYNMVRRRVARWRDPAEAGSTPGPKAAAASRSVTRRPSATRVTWILIKEEQALKDEELRLRKTLLDRCEPLRTATRLAHEFGRLVRERQKDQLDAWLDRASGVDSPSELRRFADGLRPDLDAVRAALSMPWSNGPVEGQINRLKLIKRQMYGRANFDLLRRRVLAAG